MSTTRNKYSVLMLPKSLDPTPSNGCTRSIFKPVHWYTTVCGGCTAGACHARVCAGSSRPDMFRSKLPRTAGMDCGAGDTVCGVTVGADSWRSVADAWLAASSKDCSGCVAGIAAVLVAFEGLFNALRLAVASDFVSKPMLCIHAFHATVS